LPPFQSAGQLPKYCNNVNLNVSPWEFTFSFTHFVATPPLSAGQAPEVGNFLVEQVVMSPQQAKAFLRILTDNVAKYEETLGEIHTPPPAEGGSQ
jgi:hypothetical protein